MLGGDGRAVDELLIEEVNERVGGVLLEEPHLDIGDPVLGLTCVGRHGGRSCSGPWPRKRPGRGCRP
eukprot:10523763-Alexandrium_andersonii.AAC.1